MIDLYYWPTPNAWKVSILLEELGVPYRLKPVSIGEGKQFAPEFLKISPNNKIPAIVDHDPAGSGAPLAIFESGAILTYLAEKHGRFLPADVEGKFRVLQWVFWQVGAVGPTAGQVHHFTDYAPERIAYATERFTNELHRLYGVLDHALAGESHIAGDYSIADMACWPWFRLHRQEGIRIAEFPNVQRWLDALAARPALNRGFRLGTELKGGKPTMTEEAKKILLGQRAVARPE
ncbi:glutathione S-transferase N-terminal domain-containing protein [Oceanibacterium hippocampi]|uniref:Disulfide-bond oxidoreductase YfcG n=1 Tax=Oceanibacterium hippocampi TaxID=745714 RepID=A0A1Y5TX47_9PROT|nr:glutathione S-transferase N-terminal domain-containing protein [Oceanibacterium hippocampi]SLN75530.1 Disulfide-bond oxidoreductase YfcG [Oceanibacterium hippocampi]